MGEPLRRSGRVWGLGLLRLGLAQTFITSLGAARCLIYPLLLLRLFLSSSLFLLSFSSKITKKYNIFKNYLEFKRNVHSFKNVWNSKNNRALPKKFQICSKI